MKNKVPNDQMTQKNFVAHRREKDGKIQGLWEHLNTVSSLAGQFASKIGLEKQGELIGLMHDLGKASIEFDQYIRSATGLIDPDEDDYMDIMGKKGKIDHSSAGAQVIYSHFSDKGNESLLTSQILSLAIASHHSGLIDCITPDGHDFFTKRMNKKNENTRVKESLLNLNDDIKRKMEELLTDNSLIDVLNKKIVSLKEENDSSETYIFKLGLLTRFLFSCLIDADRLNTADFEFPERVKMRNQGDYVSWTALNEKLENHLGKFNCQNSIDILRQDISNSCLTFSNKPKGLYQLTVPTGGGKTLSSLRFAINHAKEHKMDRIIYIIPYTSIIDQNAHTAREILEDKTEDGKYMNNIVLEHHSNLTPEEENTKQKLLSENWDAPVVFTTMVQFLEALFGSGTRNARRMHQLVNAVIIFDEVQTLPVKMVHLYNISIRFLTNNCRSTVVLCTATQPLLDKIIPEKRALQITPEQQMIPNVEKLYKELKRVDVYDKRKIGGWTESEVADLTEEELQETGSVLIVVNTKKSAINLFQQFLGYPRAKVFHLSTNMCPAHRMEILSNIKACLTDEIPIICVSTQLIEAGVDIDFGTVIRYLAGLDSIAQAAGRCNRHGTRPNLGKVYVVNPKEENLDKLEDIRIARDIAERVLNEYKDDPKQFDEEILSPKALERYYKYYFYDRSNVMNYPISSNSGVGRQDNLFELLSTNKLSIDAYKRINQSPPQIPLRQSFKSASNIFHAIDLATRGVIVPYGKEGERILNELSSAQYLEKQYKLLKEAQRYSVNVSFNIFDKLLKQGIIHETQKGTGIFYLDKQYYSNQYGLSETQVNEMEFLIFRRCVMENRVDFKVYGKYALFTDPLTKIGGEKYSYQIPTYQALKGILESVYWKPTIVWIIDKVRVMKAIRTQTRSTKPLNYGGVYPSLRDMGKKQEPFNTLSIYTYLFDVEYQVQAHFEWNMNRADMEKDRNENKHWFVAKRMIERGGRRDVFLGTRECQGYVEPCSFGEEDGFYDGYGELTFELMFHGFDYPDESEKNELNARFWRPKMVNGVIEFSRPEECSIRKLVKPMFANSPESIGLEEEELLEGYSEKEANR